MLRELRGPPPAHGGGDDAEVVRGREAVLQRLTGRQHQGGETPGSRQCSSSWYIAGVGRGEQPVHRHLHTGARRGSRLLSGILQKREIHSVIRQGEILDTQDHNNRLQSVCLLNTTRLRQDSLVKLWELSTSRCLIAYTGAGTTGKQEHQAQAVFNHTEDYVMFPDEATTSLCCWDAR